MNTSRMPMKLTYYEETTPFTLDDWNKMRKLATREKKGLKQMGARPTINSGATRQDGDGRKVLACKIGFANYNALFIEWKSTDAKSFVVKKDTLEKARRQALQNNDLPILVVDLKLDKYVVLGYDDWMDLMDDYERLQSLNEIVGEIR